VGNIIGSQGAPMPITYSYCILHEIFDGYVGWSKRVEKKIFNVVGLFFNWL